MGATARKPARAQCAGFQREKKKPRRSPKDIYLQNDALRYTIDSISDGFFNNDDKEEFHPLVFSLMDPDDPYLLLKDFEYFADLKK